MTYDKLYTVGTKGRTCKRKNSCKELMLEFLECSKAHLNHVKPSLGSGNDSPYTATKYFPYTILANPELEPHSPNTHSQKKGYQNSTPGVLFSP